MVISTKRSGAKIARELLEALLEPGNLLLRDFNNSGEKRRTSESIRYLKRKGLISVRENGGITELRLMKKGKEVALKYSLTNLKIKIPKKWDGKWRIVAFDIPEPKKAARNYFKLKLDQMGFGLLQKSIYVFPYSCEDEITFLAGVLEVSPYITLVVAESLTGEEKLKRRFKL